MIPHGGSRLLKKRHFKHISIFHKDRQTASKKYNNNIKCGFTPHLLYFLAFTEHLSFISRTSGSSLVLNLLNFHCNKKI